MADMTTPTLPPLPFAVFDEFDKAADDRVQDYGQACAEAARAELVAEVERWRFAFHCALTSIGAIVEWAPDAFKPSWLVWLKKTKDEMPDGSIEEGIDAAIDSAMKGESK